MSVFDSMGLVAQSAYNRAQSQQLQSDVNNIDSVKDATNFQNMVKAEFNKFVKMSPSQTLNYIRNIQPTTTTGMHTQNTGTFQNVVRSVRDTLSVQEDTTKNSLIGKASLIDVLTTTNEATNTVKMITEVRNKLLESWDKIMSMSL